MAKSRTKYEFQQKIMLLKGIADIMPYELTLPDPPSTDKIVNYGLPPEQQYFQYEQHPAELIALDKQYKSGIITREEAVAAVERSDYLSEFVEKMWRKRTGEEQEWQLINGRLIHIPPTYWFYLNFWNLNIGLPHFRMDEYHHCTDLHFFYFWDYIVVPNPYCLGAIEFTLRQTGKSYRLGCILAEPCMREYEYHAGLQSKTYEDGEQTFTKCIVKPWRKLPFYFSPIYSNSTMPKHEGLQFSPRGGKGKGNALESIDQNELMSSITFRSSETTAYDGATLIRLGGDECGKTIIVDVYERHRVNMPSLKRMGGKAFYTTTVEEMEKMGGKYFKYMWDDSNRNPNPRNAKDKRVDANGETVSGLYPWFSPSYCNRMFDEYGIAIVDKITERQKAWLKSQRNPVEKYWWMSGLEAVDYEINAQTNQQKKQEVIRKMPRTIREAFASAITKSPFRIDIINKRLEDLTYGYTPDMLEYVRFGKFEWSNGFGSDVIFEETDKLNAKFHVSYMPQEGMRNRRTPATNGRWKPSNTALFASGCDPFKHNLENVKDKNRASDASQHIYAFYDPTLGEDAIKKGITDNFVYEYLYRTDTVDEQCEDFLKACIFYGCKLYPENNIGIVKDTFKRWGYEHYIQLGEKVVVRDEKLIYKLDLSGGATTTDRMVETMARHMANFVKNQLQYCVFDRTITDIKEVDLSNLNPHDLFVSACYTLMASFEGDVTKSNTVENNEVDYDIIDLIYNGN